MSSSQQDQYKASDDIVEEEYLHQEDILEEDIEDGLEPMEDEDENDYGEVQEENPLEGYEMRPSADDENTMELADDSVQGFFEHGEPVYSIAVHPKESSIVASGGGDDKSYLWRADTGEKLFELSGHTDSVISVAFSVGGDYVASAGMDGKVYVWKSTTGEMCTSVEGPDEMIWIDWHPKGNILLAGASDGSLWMWAMPSGKFMNIFSGHAAPVTAGCFTPDGKRIVSVSEDMTCIVWDPKTAVAEVRLTSEDTRFHSEPITSVAVNKDSTLAITGSMDGKARLIHLHNGHIVAALENHSDSIETVAFCDILSLAATGSVDGTISVWDVQSHRLRHTLRHDDAIVKVTFVRNSPYLISCSVDKNVLLWDVRTGECKKKWQGHRDTVLDVAVSSDGTTIVSASDDGHCLVFST